MTFLLLALTLLGFQAPPAPPAIDNQRVQVREIDSAVEAVPYDSVWISRAGHAAFLKKGSTHKADGKGILIELKDFQVAPMANKSKYPLAFPRPGIKKLLENNRVIVWDYTWKPGVATPMHFHDKDVVVYYFEDGDLQIHDAQRREDRESVQARYDSIQPARPDPHGNLDSRQTARHHYGAEIA